MNQHESLSAGPETVEQSVLGDGNTMGEGGADLCIHGSGPAEAIKPPAFVVREPRVMADVGIRDRDEMRSIRQEVLIKGVDWAIVKNRVMFSAEAVLKVREHLQIAVTVCAQASLLASQKRPGDAGDSEPSAEKTPQRGLIPEESKPETEPLVVEVIRNSLPNKHALICRVPGTQQLVTVVGVRDNRKFLPRTKTGAILARPVPGAAAWLFAGNPDSKNGAVPHSPRWPGRW